MLQRRYRSSSTGGAATASSRISPSPTGWDYARTESLGFFLVKEADAARNLGRAALSAAFFLLPGATVFGSIIFLRVVGRLGRSRGFLWGEKPRFVGIALLHDLVFSLGWYVGIGIGAKRRLRGGGSRGGREVV